MRKIKFRGKHKELGHWVRGDLIHGRNNEVYIETSINEVIPETVGQYTGLKDKNGVEVYEGDIVKTVALLNDHGQKGAIEIATVKYAHGSYNLCLGNNEFGVNIYPLIITHTLEVIGNIHDKEV